uniref:ARAD1D28842p n=1 Tax=Blastobotrys adeninivorans TaxID=409370 RepID=A0A060TBQ0_BLAAD
MMEMNVMNDNEIDVDLIALETELVRVQQSVDRLRVQCDTLSSRKAVGSRQKPEGPVKFVPLEPSKDRENAYITNLHRLTGITGFKIKGKKYNQWMGIRLETFSDAKFNAPHYIILSPREKGGFQVANHTIPSYVPLQALEKRHLNRSLKQFAISIKRVLDRVESRRSVFQSLTASSTTNIDDVEGDESWSTVKLHLRQGGIAYLVCKDTRVVRIGTQNVSDKLSKQLAILLPGPISTLPKRLLDIGTTG